MLKAFKTNFRSIRVRKHWAWPWHCEIREHWKAATICSVSIQLHNQTFKFLIWSLCSVHNSLKMWEKSWDFRSGSSTLTLERFKSSTAAHVSPSKFTSKALKLIKWNKIFQDWLPVVVSTNQHFTFQDMLTQNVKRRSAIEPALWGTQMTRTVSKSRNNFGSRNSRDFFISEKKKFRVTTTSSVGLHSIPNHMLLLAVILSKVIIHWD